MGTHNSSELGVHSIKGIHDLSDISKERGLEDGIPALISKLKYDAGTASTGDPRTPIRTTVVHTC